MDNTRDDGTQITPTWGAHADNGEILGKESLDKWSSEHGQSLSGADAVFMAWLFRHASKRGETAIREARAPLATTDSPHSGVVP